MEFRIRPATPADRDALFDLICDHARFEHAKATLTREVLDAALRSPSPPVKIFVAAKQNDLLGYAALTHDYSLWRGRRWAHLDCLFVREGCRGMSIGGELLGVVTGCARDWGADRLEWQTPSWNEWAIAFYKRQNAEGLPKMRFGIAL